MKRVRMWLALAGIVAVSVTSRLGAQVSVYVGSAPPPAVVEHPPVRPGPDYIWQAGHYTWDGRRYVWVPGAWILPPRPHAVWAPGRWDHDGHGYHWVEGRWR
jgi:hypothetical protein